MRRRMELAGTGQRPQLVEQGDADSAFLPGARHPPVASPWGGVHFVSLLFQVLTFLLVVGTFIAVIICCVKEREKLDDISDKIGDQASALGDKVDKELGEQVCGIGCNPIDTVPISLWTGCHFLSENFTWLGPGPAITVNGRHKVDLCFDHNLLEIGGSNVGVWITNGSTQVRVHDARIFTAVQTEDFFASRGVLVDSGSEAELLNGYLRNLGIGVRTDSLASVTVRNYKIYGVSLVNTTFFRAIGVDCFDSVQCNVYDTYVHIPQLEPVPDFTTFDTDSFGFVARRTLIPLDSGIGRSYFENVEADRCNSGIYLRQGQHAYVRHARITINPFFTFSGVAIGSPFQGTSDVVHIDGLEINMEQGTKLADGLIIANVRSARIEKLRIYGFVEPLEGNYRGAHITIGSPSAIQDNPLRTTSVTIQHADLVNTRMNTPTVQIFGGKSPGNMSVILRDSQIFGGLAGVLMLEKASAVAVENVKVTNASICYAVTNTSQANVFLDNEAARCCVGYFFDNTTLHNRMQRNGVSQVGFAVQNSGTGNTLDAPHAAGILDGCTPPPLDFAVSIAAAPAAWMSAKYGYIGDESAAAAA